MNTTRFALRSSLAAAAALGLAGLGAGAASAHVHVNPDSTAAGSSSVLSFDFAHGCGTSPTTEIAITLPDQLDDATPTAHPGWTVEKVTEKLDEPKKAEGGATVTERVSQIVYTAKEPVADGVRDVLQLQVKLPDAAGETLAFPVLQTCEEGWTDWAQVAEEGQDAHSLESPAPTMTLTAAQADGHGHAAAQPAAQEAGATSEAVEASPASSTTSDGGAGVAGWVGL
ncbi:nuclear export factor GLE1 family protein, partial [Arthrobacter crystallopoietes BAB-32]